MGGVVVCLQLLEKNGIEQFNPMGHKFDPHLHDAKFEVPDATKEPGTVVFVSKVCDFWDQQKLLNQQGTPFAIVAVPSSMTNLRGCTYCCVVYELAY